MKDLFSQDSMAEFFVQTIVSHWFVAILLVALVALFVTSRKTLNATTRHNIWLITLVSFLLMPILAFIPKPQVNVNLLELLTVQNVEVGKNDSLVSSTRTISTDNPDLSNIIVDTSSDTKAKNLSEITENKELLSSRNFELPATASSQPVAESITTQSSNMNFPVLLKALFIFWIIGSLYFIRRLWGEYRAARELELQSDSVTPYFERRFAELCQPMTVGLIRVWVAIPMTWREEIDDDIFDQTLTHELGHISRKDPLVNTLQRLINIVFWMYPAVWYVSRQLELERESACDDWVLTHDGKGHTYANNLLNVAESLYLQPHVLAVGCLRSHSQLSRRIQNLLNKSSDHAVKNSWKLLAATTIGLMATLSASAVMWPTAPENTPVTELAGQSAGSTKAVPDMQINFSESNGVQVLRYGVEVQEKDAQLVHDPIARPAPNPIARPMPPVSPKVGTNFGGDTHDYSYSEDGVTTNYIRSKNGRYGNGSLSIKQKVGKSALVKLKPSIKARKSPLLHAAWHNDFSEVKSLLRKGKNINKVYQRPTLPRTALNAAILKGNMEMVEFLHEAGADIDNQNSNWIESRAANPLSVAAMVGNKNISKYLLNQGAEADDSTLVVAVQSKNTDLVELLLKQDLDVDEDTLVVAVKHRDKDMLDLLLKHDVEVSDNAIIVAVQNGDKKTVKRLLKEVDDIDDSALVVAIQNQDDDMINMLLDAGAEANDVALIVAVQSGNKSLVKRLIKAGADIGEGALVIAIPSQDNDMIEWLIDAGAKVDDGAFILAMQTGDKKIINLIQDEYKGDLDYQSYSKNKSKNKHKHYSHDDSQSMSLTEALEGLESLEALEGLEELEKLSEKFGEKAGIEIANSMVNFMGDMAKNGGNVESIALVKALEMEDINLAIDLLNDGAIPNTLHITQALELDNAKLARKLLEKGAVPNALNILQALENEEPELAKLFIENGAEPNGVVMLKAMENEDKELVELVRSYMHKARND